MAADVQLALRTFNRARRRFAVGDNQHHRIRATDDHSRVDRRKGGGAIQDHAFVLFAQTAKKNPRDSDLLGRLGGEEFAAVLYDTSESQELDMTARLRVAFEQITQNVETHPVCATMSVGLVHCQAPLLDVPSLLAQADQALYFAKERGRNRVELANLGMVLERKDAPTAVPPAQSAA